VKLINFELLAKSPKNERGVTSALCRIFTSPGFITDVAHKEEAVERRPSRALPDLEKIRRAVEEDQEENY